MEKYHPSRVIQDFVFSSQKSGCIRYISLQVYIKCWYQYSNLEIYVFMLKKIYTWPFFF